MTEIKSVKFHRKGPDLIIRAFRFIQFLSFLFVITIVSLFGLAKPRVKTLYDTYYNVNIQSQWKDNLIHTAYYVMIMMLILSIIGIILNLKRLKRKTDHFCFSLVFFALCSIVGIIIYHTSR